MGASMAPSFEAVPNYSAQLHKLQHEKYTVLRDSQHVEKSEQCQGVPFVACCFVKSRGVSRLLEIVVPPSAVALSVQPRCL